MTYEEFKEKLNKNLQELMNKCDEWEVSLYEVIKYWDYIQKLLNQFKQTEWQKKNY